MAGQIRFVVALWRANVQAAMEYRASFLAQAIGMFANNTAFFGFWALFFQRFHEVRGWRLGDVLLLYGMAAAGYGVTVYLFGNVTRLSTVIAEGELDHYLSLPRPVLVHSLAGRSQQSGPGDALFGVAALAAAGATAPGDALRFALGAALAGVVFAGVLTAVHALSFWTGNSSLLGNAVQQAMILFSTYPLAIFDGWTRVLIFTVVPAAFVGAVPASLVRSFSWASLGELGAAAVVWTAVGAALFHRGLARYQSGSAILPRL